MLRKSLTANSNAQNTATIDASNRKPKDEHRAPSTCGFAVVLNHLHKQGPAMCTSSLPPKYQSEKREYVDITKIR